MPATQKTRAIAVSSPLGEDVLLFRRMKGTEQLGHLYEYHLELLSEDPEIKMDDVLGQGMTVSLETGGGTRYFHGLTVAFSQVEDRSEYASYRATLRPWLWFLTRTADCRIFQEMTVPDIIKQVFRDEGFTDFQDKLSGSYRKWEYLVQYRETDFNFVSRLMEQEGIYYYFEHEKDKHTLVLADDYSSHAPIADYDTVPYFPNQPNVRPERDHIYEWSVSRQVQPGAYVLNDFDFERPKADLEVTLKAPKPRKHAHADSEVYDYPGQYVQSSDGDNYIRARIQELQAEWEQVDGRGNARGLYPGGLFSLDGYPRSDQNREYLIVGATYELASDAYEPEPTAAPEEPYTCAITAIDSKEPYRARRVTPKPVVQGPQTAIVVGKSGEEIWTDKYGRVKVQFHWDREGKSDENSSCWVRVAQLWAGKTWGGIHIPRIGQEVIVEFLEGDPDRPIITGRVYNKDNMPPYALPANQTQSGIQSRSTKKGDAKTFNELRFEDKKDEEEVYFHAEKDFDRVVENNDTLKVGFDKMDKGDQKIEIYNDREITVGNNEKRSIGYEIKDSGDQEIKVYNDRTVTIGNNDTLTVEKGDHTIAVKQGQTTHEAMKAIELKVGQSSIKIEPSKITIKSPQVNIEGDMQALLKGGVTATVEGGAMTVVKGGIVQIN